MFNLDGQSHWQGDYIQPPDGVSCEIKAMPGGTYHLAVCHMKTHKKATTKFPMCASAVRQWLDDTIRNEFSPAWNCEDFNWQTATEDELVYLRDH